MSDQNREYLKKHSDVFELLCPENQEGLVEQLDQGLNPDEVVLRSYDWLHQERFEAMCMTQEGEANEYSFYS